MTEAPRVLVYDIETAPDVSYTFGPKWKTNVAAFQQPWYVLSVAWKWLGDRKVHVKGLDDYGTAGTCDDSQLVAGIKDLFDEADIVVTHNGKAFDGPRVNTRLLVHEYEPPSPYAEVDTCILARKHFGFQSNSLADLCRFLGLDHKADAGGIQTWVDCMNGDPKAWRRMKRYNKQDVLVLEQLYLRLRPWVRKHPNLATIGSKPNACPRCSAEGQMNARGWSYNSVTKRRQFQCGSCGGYSYGRALVRTSSDYVSP